ELLAKIFPAQLQLNYLAQAIKTQDYEAFIEDQKKLVTTASLKELHKIHALAIGVLNKAPVSQNKDIRRFLSIYSLGTSNTHDAIAQFALDNKIINEVNQVYHFNMDVYEAYSQMEALLGRRVLDEDEEILESDYPDMSIVDGSFDGGKIVFIKNGEVQNSTIDDLLNNTSKEKIEDTNENHEN
ncbi:MAG: hypothetical protein ACXAD7_18240, partial [Candidatus Kariarchaeaceae archaeon]